MRIGMLLPSTFPPDIRVEKEAHALMDCGHEVSVLCIKENDQPEYEEYRGIKVYRFNPFPAKKDFRRALVITPIINPWWFKPWKTRIEKFIRDFMPDVLHIHDIQLLHRTIPIARKHGIKVVSDMHEPWPEFISILRSNVKRSGSLVSYLHEKYVVYSPFIYSIIEKKGLRMADEIITINDYMADKFRKITGKEVHVIMNTSSVDDLMNLGIKEEVVKKYSENFVVGYVGGIAPLRGVDILVKSASILREDIKNLKVVIVGDHRNEYGEELLKMSTDLGVDDIVEFTGWKPFELVPSYIAASDVSAIPYRKTPLTVVALPHKIFQYMALEKPVLVTELPVLSGVVKETNCGLVVSEDPGDMAKAILKLYRDPELRKKMGKNGRKAVLEKYNWEHDAEKLCKIYSRLSSSKSSLP